MSEGKWYHGAIEKDEREAGYGVRLRFACRWVLDFLQYLLVVGLLQYIATKTKNNVVEAIAFVGYGAFTLYFQSVVSG